MSLEHVRANQPQYTPSFLEDQEDDCDMDLTLAHGGHITTCIPVVPNFFKPGAKQLAMNSGNKVLRYHHSICLFDVHIIYDRFIPSGHLHTECCMCINICTLVMLCGVHAFQCGSQRAFSIQTGKTG